MFLPVLPDHLESIINAQLFEVLEIICRSCHVYQIQEMLGTQLLLELPEYANFMFQQTCVKMATIKIPCVAASLLSIKNGIIDIGAFSNYIDNNSTINLLY